MNPIGATKPDPSMNLGREAEKEGDALVRQKRYGDAARKFGEAATYYHRASSSMMAATAESKRVTAVNNAKSGTDEYSASQAMSKWAASKKR
jgi:hypothetical protein